MALLKEKIGYGFGDMASSMFWKVFSYYLPFFYSNVFGLSLVDAAFLVLITRIWDAVSDPMMGIIADRTHTRWGKYRPYLLWIAAPFSICGILLFTTPDWGYAAKLVWAYVTYILMMTVYTGINVPYGAMLGVITDNPKQKTVFSSFRMFFAYVAASGRPVQRPRLQPAELVAGSHDSDCDMLLRAVHLLLRHDPREDQDRLHRLGGQGLQEPDT